MRIVNQKVVLVLVRIDGTADPQRFYLDMREMPEEFAPNINAFVAIYVGKRLARVDRNDANIVRLANGLVQSLAHAIGRCENERAQQNGPRIEKGRIVQRRARCGSGPSLDEPPPPNEPGLKLKTF